MSNCGQTYARRTGKSTEASEDSAESAAREIAKEAAKGTRVGDIRIVHNVITSHVVPEMIAEAGAQPVRTRTLILRFLTVLPRTRLGRKQLTKLKVYAGPEHPHVAQKPTPMEIET